MNLSTLKSLTIPEGKVTQIDVGEHTLWKAIVLPDEYQQVEWICSYPGMSSYLDLGFAFDTSAEIYMEQYLDSVRLDEWTYMFGAAENDGIYRCMWSAPGYEHHILYGSTGSDYITSGNESTCLYTGKNKSCLVNEMLTEALKKILEEVKADSEKIDPEELEEMKPEEWEKPDIESLEDLDIE